MQRQGLELTASAWDELVRRYAGLVLFVVRSHGLSPADEEAVSRLVWLRLVERLDRIDAGALPAWLAAVTREECAHVQRLRPDPDGVLEAASRHQALREALDQLVPADRDLLTMLAADPPLSEAEISRALGIPVPDIGPARSRVLAQVRANLTVVA